MKLHKALLGAILVGVAVQTTSCKKGEDPKPKGERAGESGKNVIIVPANCPACGMG